MVYIQVGHGGSQTGNERTGERVTLPGGRCGGRREKKKEGEEGEEGVKETIRVRCWLSGDVEDVEDVEQEGDVMLNGI